MRKEIEEVKVKTDNEHRNIMSSEGMELVPLMKDKQTGDDCTLDFCWTLTILNWPGKPHKDPSTGYMMSHGLSSTDVTRLADKAGYVVTKSIQFPHFDNLVEGFCPPETPWMTEKDTQTHSTPRYIKLEGIHKTWELRLIFIPDSWKSWLQPEEPPVWRGAAEATLRVLGQFLGPAWIWGSQARRGPKGEPHEDAALPWQSRRHQGELEGGRNQFSPTCPCPTNTGRHICVATSLPLMAVS